ncbi:DPP IV N-terminal domain-containing protein [Paenibacillus sp. 481]|uniref:DPP IV N-terminal domain-containing protein n=1 Tax=Paenibacillus sp. 481 TaxID=2835869 RepID=UPI001E60A8BA|nr:DPP IV N-terminal domain-containing protein [Paenibacillus sp. 481]UHA74246.1 DPP IV N-terminal domain-containing protein [Paenibacillus sp. 481]
MANELTGEHYARAEKMFFSTWTDYVENSRVIPNWIGQSNQFWYKRDFRLGTGKGSEFVVVNPSLNTVKPAFDHQRLASALSTVLNKPIDANHLPITYLTIHDEDQSIQFDADQVRWECSLLNYICIRMDSVPRPARNELLSPDGQWAAFTEQFNLFVRHLLTGEIRQLTFNGEQHYDYAGETDPMKTITNESHKSSSPPNVIWSPDSTKLLTVRLDQRAVRETHLVQSVPFNKQEVRPVLHSARYAMPGDTHIPLEELFICHIQSQDTVKIQTDPIPAQGRTICSPDLPLAGWSADSTQAYYIHISRDHKSARLILVDSNTGATHPVIEEQSDTFLFFHLYPYGNLNISQPSSELLPLNFRLLQDNTFICHSERDGWAHLYVIHANTGQIIRSLTAGKWNVRRLVAVDEDSGWVYFTASGRELKRDPYFQHVYRVRLDGTDLSLLTPEDANHTIVFAPDLKYFVDTYSRVDLPPISVLCEADGSVVRELEQADILPLMELGYQLPERFTVKAHDGETDLYGIIVRPAEFDPARKYPLIDCCYGGPQIAVTPKSFIMGDARIGGLQAFAQLGFVTIIMDGRGTPFRSRAFHDYSAGNLGGAAGLIDHAHAVKQLAQQFPYIDTERVGIWGYSGGGYAAARAILKYPDIYKVAVSGAGNHEQLMYTWIWGEHFQGMVDPQYPDRYADQDNTRLAASLKGKLLLAHGDIDNNVYAAHTLRLADALIKANKDFDLLILPNVGHNITSSPYFVRRKWDYFVKHLLGVEPPKEYSFRTLDAEPPAPSELPDITLKEPTGAYQVGTETYYWIDTLRADTFSEDSADNRELMVQVWYPTHDNVSLERQVYSDHPELFAESYADYIGLPAAILTKLAEVQTNSIPGAPIATEGQQYPVLIFSHGFGATMNSYTFLTEQLASEGYIVVSINHTYSAAFTLFPHGRVARMVKPELTNIPYMDQLNVEVWVKDVQFILDQIEQLSGCSANPVFERMDMNRIGILGHSFGGATAAQALLQDTRLKAGLNMDGGFFGHPIPDAGIEQPFLYMYTKDVLRDNLPKWISQMEQMGIPHAEAEHFAEAILIRSERVIDSKHHSLLLEQSSHMSFSDIPLAAPQFSWHGSFDHPDAHDVKHVQQTHQVIQDYALDFFDHYLKGKQLRLLADESAKYDDVSFIKVKAK